MSDRPDSPSDIAIQVEHVSKFFRLYDRPEDRLIQMLSFGRSKRYREYQALKDVSFTVRRGESVAIVGPNGAGKTTLLSVIAGITQPSQGHVSVKGRMAVMLALGSAFNPEFTGRENMRMTCAIMGLSEAEIATQEPSIENFAGIGDFIDQPVRIYSSGMQARLAFAVAAHVDAEILVVDEILSVGDAVFAQRCARFIRQFRKRGTLLFVSHDLSAALTLCERAIWLDHGSVQLMGPTREVIYNYSAWSMKSGAADPSAYKIEHAPIPGKDIRADAHPESFVTEADIFDFDENVPAQGEGGARVISVNFADGISGAQIQSVRGGDNVALHVTAEAHEAISHPVIGFFVRDRLGQILFGDNTFIALADRTKQVDAGSNLRARFTFLMPYLPTGDYSITAAIADEPPPVGRMLHWLEGALSFKVVNSHIAQGLVGIAMSAIDMDVEPKSSGSTGTNYS